MKILRSEGNVSSLVRKRWVCLFMVTVVTQLVSDDWCSRHHWPEREITCEM